MRKKQREILQFVEGFDYDRELNNLPLFDTKTKPRLLTSRMMLLKMLKLQFRSFWCMELIVILVALLNGFYIGYDCLVAGQSGETYYNIAALGFLLCVAYIGYRRHLKMKAHTKHLYFILIHDVNKPSDLDKLLIIHRAAFDCPTY